MSSSRIFDDKARPSRFAHVFGQRAVLTDLKAHVLVKHAHAYLLAGPQGTGKTSIAGIVAKALLCSERLDSHEPCNQCRECREVDYDSSTRFRFIHCGKSGNIEEIREFADFVRYEPFGRDVHKVGVLDEVHAATPSSLKALTGVLEPLPKNTTLLLLTTNLKRVPLDLQSRCTCLELKPIDTNEALSCAIFASEANGWEFEPEALAALVKNASGDLRKLNGSLKFLGEKQKFALSDVIAHLGSAPAQIVARYLRSTLSRETFTKQKEVLDDWMADTIAKADALQALMLTLLEILEHESYATAVSKPVDAELWWILQQLGNVAFVSGSSLPAFLQRLATFWTISQQNARPAMLNAKLLEFDAMLQRQQSAAPEFRLGRSTVARRTGNAAHRSTSGGTPRYLDKSDVKALWDAASFMTQVHGVRINIRISVEYGKLRRRRGTMASSSSRLVDQLTAALKRWSPTIAHEFHWLTLQENPPGIGLSTHLCAHIPAKLHQDVCYWLRGSYLLLISEGAQEGALRIRCCGDVSPEAKLRFHRYALISLSRGLDPSLSVRDEHGNRCRLADVLQIPPALQREAGEIVGFAKRRFSLSRSLSAAARKVAASGGFLPWCPFHDGAWRFLHSGWEETEFADRRRWHAGLSQAMEGKAEAHMLKEGLFPGSRTQILWK